MLTCAPLTGTYNNQYMVLDRSRVKLGHSVDDGALTVVEQIPGLVEYSDQTQALRRGTGWVHCVRCVWETVAASPLCFLQATGRPTTSPSTRRSML